MNNRIIEKNEDELPEFIKILSHFYTESSDALNKVTDDARLNFPELFNNKEAE